MLLAVAAATAGCSLFSTVCLSLKKSGEVATLTGHIAAGEVQELLVPYDQQGSQNDLRISWDGQSAPGGADIRVYATGLACADFVPSAEGTVTDRGDACAEIGARLHSRSDTGSMRQHGIVVPGGPGQGRPDLHEYKLFVVGDAARAADYTISITWFSGPDC